MSKELIDSALVLANSPPEQAAPAVPHVSNHFDLLALALSKDAAIDVIERLAALQQAQIDRENKNAFNDAMHAAQSEISNVIPDMTNSETQQKYASFKALNRAIRPVYLKHGFDLSFNGAESSKPDEVLILCDVSHQGGWTKQYMLPMPCDGKGAKGGGVMSKSHAMLAATSYGRSGLLKLIFNIAIGEDDPIATNGELAQVLERFGKTREWDHVDNPPDGPHAGLKQLYVAAYSKYEAEPAILKIVVAAKNVRKKEMGW